MIVYKDTVNLKYNIPGYQRVALTEYETLVKVNMRVAQSLREEASDLVANHRFESQTYEGISTPPPASINVV